MGTENLKIPGKKARRLHFTTGFSPAQYMSEGSGERIPSAKEGFLPTSIFLPR
jgi:hypothetical protein